MATLLMTEKYDTDIYGVLNCYDRVVISGQLESLCHAKGMTKYLYTHNIRIFDYPELSNRCERPFEPMRKPSLRRMDWRSSSSGQPFARKIGSSRSSSNEAINQVWCIFFRRWNSVRPIAPGTTRPATKPMSK